VDNRPVGGCVRCFLVARVVEFQQVAGVSGSNDHPIEDNSPIPRSVDD
jgi:hypothetical protein